MFKFDLSKFKKITGDKHTTTMQHEDGHTLVLDHKKLHPVHVKALAKLKMADGGEVEPDNKDQMPSSGVDQFVEGFKKALGDDKDKKNTQKQQPKDQKEQKLADGGDVIPYDKLVPEEQANNAPYMATQDQSSLDNTVPSPIQTPAAPIQQDPDAGQGDQGTDAPQPAAPTSAQPQQQQAPQETPQPDPTQDPVGLMKQGYQQQLGGIQQEAQAQGQLGKNQAEARQNYANQLNKAQSFMEDHYKQLLTEHDKRQADIEKGYIDPDKYWNNHSKVLSTIGLILGGFGAAVSHGRNLALDTLNTQIDRDVAAQQKNLDTKQNLLKANMDMFHNINDATSMTKLMLQDQVVNQLEKQAALAQDPVKKAQAMQAAGQLKQQMAPQFLQFGFKTGMMQAVKSGFADKNPEGTIAMANLYDPKGYGETLSKAYVPGIGFSKTMQEVPQDIRKTLSSQLQLMNGVNDLRKFINDRGGPTAIMSPKFNADRARAITKVQELGQQYRQAVGAGVNESEADKIENKILSSDPLSIMNYVTSDPKLEQLNHDIMQKHNILRQTYALPPIGSPKDASPNPVTQLPPMAQGHVKWAQITLQNPKATPVQQNKARLTLKKYGIQ